MVKKLDKLPRWANDFLVTLSAHARNLKLKIYLVGGVVRDLTLGKEIFDLDIAVEGDALALAQSLARHYRLKLNQHHAFGTATLYLKEHTIDFATTRKEDYPQWGALPKVRPAGLKEDLLRRDFTINALAVSLNGRDYGKLIDLCGGLPDLKKGLIRVMHKDSFLDDPTRILRAVRFEQRFDFRFEKGTFALIKQALRRGALGFIHPHRLRDELILTLEEPKPYRYLKRINALTNFSFIDRRIKLREADYRLILRTEKALRFYREEFKKDGRLEDWLIYFAAIVLKIPLKGLLQLLSKLGLRRGEQKIILSIKKNLARIKRLDNKLLPHRIFSLLDSLSFEAVVFFYAYYPQRRIRKNIKFFLERLAAVRLIIKGGDLKRLGIGPLNLYGSLLEELLYAKMNKGLKTKEEELKEALSIFDKLKQRHYR